VNCRPDAPRQYVSLIFLTRILTLFFLAAVLVFAVGCRKKPAELTSAEIRNITREIVFAARNASGGRAEVGTRPEFSPRQQGKPQALVTDDIYITVPRVTGGAPDQAAHDAILAELSRVADDHHLERVLRPGAPGLERFDYVVNGRRTQSIDLITPLPKAGAPSRSPERARLAIVVDDLGYNRAQADDLFRLAYPLTVSVLPNEASSAEIAEEAHRRGYEVMLHLPMASNDGGREEAIELHPGMAPEAVERTLAAMLDTVPYAAGVNNHEGSLVTADQKLMDELMPLLRQRDLFFIDSRTTAATVAETTARATGVAAARRNVFLDDEPSMPAIHRQFALAIREARKTGAALAIGHPHPETIEALNELLPEAERQGVRLVYASDVTQ
jgi:polysaccharide deacetylase 2 family uncharacterized protein YibQ